MTVSVSELDAGTALLRDELVLVSQLSTTITAVAATISAVATGNKLHCTGSEFNDAGFTAGSAIQITGFTGQVANNYFSARLSSVDLEAGDIFLRSDFPLLDDAAGETVHVTQWVSIRPTLQDINEALAFVDLSDGKIIDEDGALAANSNGRLATQAAIVTYVTAAVASAVAGINWKAHVRVATTAAGTLATSFENGDTVDGVVLATGNRILIKNQASGTENGIYVVAASGAPTRATDADAGSELVNAAVFVSEGTANADTQWVCTTNATITIGATSLVFAQFGMGGLVDGDMGDITVSGTGTVLTIDNDAVTYAKMQNVTTARLLGRATAGSGDTEEITLGSGLSFTGTTLNGGGSNAGKHAIPIMAGAMLPSVSGGCAPLDYVATAADKPDLVHLSFDPSTAEYAQFSMPMPKSWDEGTVTFKPVWSHPSTTTNFGVVWQLQAVAVSNDDAISVAYGTAQTSTDTGGTTDDLYLGPESSAITIAGTPASEDFVFFRISRLPTDGSDTMAVDARLHGIMLYITTDAATDA